MWKFNATSRPTQRHGGDSEVTLAKQSALRRASGRVGSRIELTAGAGTGTPRRTSISVKEVRARAGQARVCYGSGKIPVFYRLHERVSVPSSLVRIAVNLPLAQRK